MRKTVHNHLPKLTTILKTQLTKKKIQCTKQLKLPKINKLSFRTESFFIFSHFTSIHVAPFRVARDDVKRLKPERVRRPAHGRYVPEIAQPFDDQADGVAPIPHDIPKPLLPPV